MLAAAALVMAAPARAQPAAQGDTPVTITHVTRQDLPEYTRGIGTVQAYRQVLVRARVDGNLDTIAFREGQEVHPGDLLAQIDPRPYAAALAQAKAKRASDQAMIDNAQRDLVRYASLVRTNVASRQQVDTQQALVAQDQASLQGDDAAIAAGRAEPELLPDHRADRRCGRPAPGRHRQPDTRDGRHRHRHHRPGASDQPGVHPAAGPVAGNTRRHGGQRTAPRRWRPPRRMAAP